MKESDMWRRIATNLDRNGGSYLLTSYLRCHAVGLCTARNMQASTDKQWHQLNTRMHLFKPQASRAYWWGCPECRPKKKNEGRTLAAWFLYHMALDDERKAARAALRKRRRR